MTLIQLYLCLNAIEDYTEDIAMFANSWLVLTPDDTKCVPTPSDFPNPCSSGMPAFEVSSGKKKPKNQKTSNGACWA
jgi:hypothetical protein